MAGRRQRKYDDEAVAQDLACGEFTAAQIAERHGLSASMVAKIACGVTRPDIQERVKAITDGHLEQARNLGKRLAGVAMARLGSLVGKDSEAGADVQRKAAVDILAHAMGDPSKTDVNVNQTNLPGVEPEDWKAFLEHQTTQKGGPK